MKRKFNEMADDNSHWLINSDKVNDMMVISKNVNIVSIDELLKTLIGDDVAIELSGSLITYLDNQDKECKELFIVYHADSNKENRTNQIQKLNLALIELSSHYPNHIITLACDLNESAYEVKKRRSRAYVSGYRPDFIETINEISQHVTEVKTSESVIYKMRGTVSKDGKALLGNGYLNEQQTKDGVEDYGSKNVIIRIDNSTDPHPYIAPKESPACGILRFDTDYTGGADHSTATYTTGSLAIVVGALLPTFGKKGIKSWELVYKSQLDDSSLLTQIASFKKLYCILASHYCPDEPFNINEILKNRTLFNSMLLKLNLEITEGFKIDKDSGTEKLNTCLTEWYSSKEYNDAINLFVDSVQENIRLAQSKLAGLCYHHNMIDKKKRAPLQSICEHQYGKDKDGKDNIHGQLAGGFMSHINKKECIDAYTLEAMQAAAIGKRITGLKKPCVIGAFSEAGFSKSKTPGFETKVTEEIIKNNNERKSQIHKPQKSFFSSASSTSAGAGAVIEGENFRPV